MAEIRESQTVTETRSILIASICDLCRQKFELEEGERIEVQRIEGGPYGGVIELFDVCSKCWQDKVVPFFQSNGSQPRKVDF